MFNFKCESSEVEQGTKSVRHFVMYVSFAWLTYLKFKIDHLKLMNVLWLHQVELAQEGGKGKKKRGPHSSEPPLLAI